MYRTSSVLSPEFLHIPDAEGRFHYGADQEWYPLLWQRKAGCGPTTASHLCLYVGKKNPSYFLPKVEDKQTMIELMEAMWLHVTPGIMGTHLVSQFSKGLTSFFAERELNLNVDTLALSKSRNTRPSFETVIQFLENSLGSDQPVAFLNLHSGAVTNLDSWHWVTIVGFSQSHADAPVFIDVYDGGQVWKVDLSLWYETTTRSGGFASIVG